MVVPKKRLVIKKNTAISKNILYNIQKGKIMNRRDFVKKTLVFGGAAGFAGLGSTASLFAQGKTAGAGYPDIAAVKGGEPDVMFRKGINALGGHKTVRENRTVCSYKTKYRLE